MASSAGKRFFADHFLTQVEGLTLAVMEGAEGVLSIEDGFEQNAANPVQLESVLTLTGSYLDASVSTSRLA